MRRSGSLLGPCAVAVAVAGAEPIDAAELPPGNTGVMYVGAFHDDEVAVYAADGKHLGSLKAPGLDGPRGIVAMPDGSLYVASQFTNLIYVFDERETLSNIFTHSSLRGPHGMMALGDELHVCSFLSDRVVVFDLDGRFRRWYAGGGMDGPTGIAADGAGNIWVTSVFPPAILKFNGQGQLLDRFEPPGLVSPAGIARDRNDTIYVASSAGDVVLKLNVSGTLLGYLHHDRLDGPQDLAFDDRDHLFVSSYFRSELFGFDGVGDFVGTRLMPRAATPRSIAFRRMEAGDVDDSGEVGFADMIEVLAAWGACPALPETCLADVDRDGDVGFSDVLLILANWYIPDGTPGG